MTQRILILKKINLGLIFVLLFSTSFIEFSSSIINSNTTNSANFVDFLTNPTFEDIHYLFGKISTWRESFEIEGESVVSDAKGNSYFTGTILTDFLGNSDIILGKINSTGSVEWISIHNYLTIDVAYDLCIDNFTDLIYLTGAVTNSSRINSADLFIGCYDSITGTEIWNNTFGDAVKSEIGYSIEFYDNNLYVAGIKSEYVGIELEKDIFLACIDSFSGLSIWSKILESSEYNSYNPKLKLDLENEEFYLAFNNEISSDGQMNNHYSLQKYSFAGNLTWEINSVQTDDIRFNDFTVDFFNNYLYLLGDQKNSNAPTFRDTIIIKYDLNGFLLDKFIYGSSECNEIGQAIAVDSKQNIILAGYATSDLQSNDVAFMAKLSSTGEIMWTGKNEKYLRSTINSITINSLGYSVIVGFAEGKYDYIFQRLFVSYTIDEDDDNLSSFWELEIGTDPTIFDTDQDGFSDGHEYLHNTDPLNKLSNFKTREALYSLGLSLTIIAIVISIIFNFFIQKNSAKKTSPIVRFYDRIISLFKRKKRKKQD